MLPIGPTTQVLVMHEPVSFRNGIDGTVAIARLVLEKEPMGGAMFVFRNKNRRMLRVLHYDGSGYWLCTKRLSKGCFSAWPQGDGTSACSPLLARELQVLIWGGNPGRCAFPQLWRKVA